MWLLHLDETALGISGLTSRQWPVGTDSSRWKYFSKSTTDPSLSQTTLPVSSGRAAPTEDRAGSHDPSYNDAYVYFH